MTSATKRFELILISGIVLIDLLFALLAGVFSFDGHAHYQEQLQATGNNLVTLLEQSIADKARLVDDAVVRVERALERQLRAGATDKNRLGQILDLEQEQLPEIDAIRITNGQGDVVFGKGVIAETHASYADRQFFAQHRERTAHDLIITEPIQGKVSNQWVIAFTRSYHSDDGSFAGVISAAVPVATFEKLLVPVNLGRTDTVVLRYADMGLIARVPKIEGAAGTPGHKKVSKEFTDIIESGASEATFHTARTPDAVERTYFFRRLADWPFTIAVGLVDEEYSAPWRAQIIVVAILLGAFFLVTSASAWLAVRYLRERVRSEETIRDNEEKYRVLFNNEIYAICIFDLQTYRFLDVNDAYTHLYGYSRAELLAGMTINDITAEQQNSDAATRQAVRQGTILIPLRYHRKKDGTVFPVEIVGGPYQWQGREVMFGLAHDISSRKVAEDALLASEQRFRNLFANNSAMMLIIDPATGSIIEGNQAAADFYGWPVTQLCLKKIQEINLLRPEGVMAEMHDVVSSGSKKFEFLHRCADGSIKNVEVFSSLIETGGKMLLYSIIHDTTERKRAEAASKMSEQRLASEQKKIEAQQRQFERQQQQIQKADSLNSMAGAIAHHFNNQLGGVMGNLEMAMDDLPSNLGVVRILNSAMRGARKAAQVSGMLLTYLGQTTGVHSALDLSEVCRRSLPLLQAAAPKEVLLTVDLSPSGSIINGDTNQIQQILMNLVVNALEANEDNKGEITLTVRRVFRTDIPEMHRLPLDWQAQAPVYACLEVRDNGGGIAEEDMDKLFDPFFSSKFVGRGLGLSVVLGLVKAHQGAIAVESEKGQGSTFRVFLPLSDGVVAPALDTTLQPAMAADGRTVLVVEDEEILRDMVTTMLRRLGFKVVVAKDGVAAVALFRQHPEEIHVVLSDLSMPRMNGWETLANLRRIRPGIPVILASGYDEAKAFGGNHDELPQVFLHKPYEKAALRDALAKAMQSE